MGLFNKWAFIIEASEKKKILSFLVEQQGGKVSSYSEIESYLKKGYKGIQLVHRSILEGGHQRLEKVIKQCKQHNLTPLQSGFIEHCSSKHSADIPASFLIDWSKYSQDDKETKATDPPTPSVRGALAKASQSKVEDSESDDDESDVTFKLITHDEPHGAPYTLFQSGTTAGRNPPDNTRSDSDSDDDVIFRLPEITELLDNGTYSGIRVTPNSPLKLMGPDSLNGKERKRPDIETEESGDSKPASPKRVKLGPTALKQLRFETPLPLSTPTATPIQKSKPKPTLATPRLEPQPPTPTQTTKPKPVLAAATPITPTPTPTPVSKPKPTPIQIPTPVPSVRTSPRNYNIVDYKLPPAPKNRSPNKKASYLKLRDKKKSDSSSDSDSDSDECDEPEISPPPKTAPTLIQTPLKTPKRAAHKPTPKATPKTPARALASKTPKKTPKEIELETLLRTDPLQYVIQSLSHGTGKQVGFKGRDSEYEALFSFCKDCLSSRTAGSVYLCGKPGTGKSLTVSTVISDISKWAKSEANKPDIISVNCNQIQDPKEIYAYLLRAHPRYSDQPVSQAEKQLKSIIFDQDRMTIVVLDEIDNLLNRQSAILYKFFEWASHEQSGLILIGISNVLDLVNHSLHLLTKGLAKEPKTIAYKPYTAEQLIEVIESRVAVANVFEPSAILLCAKKVAAVDGDVRKALDICMEAARDKKIATRAKPSDDSNKIKVNDMVAAVRRQLPSEVDRIATLTVQAQTVLCGAVMLIQGFSQDQLHDSYKSMCKQARIQPVSQHEFQDIVETLRGYSLLDVTKRKKTELISVPLTKEDLMDGMDSSLQSIKSLLQQHCQPGR